MSYPMMLAKPEEIDTTGKRQKYTVTIVGCDTTGIFQAVIFAEAGFKVICADNNLTKINHITKCKLAGFKSDMENKIRDYLKTGRLSATTDIKKAVSQSNIIAIAIPTKIDSKKKPDYSAIKNTCKIIGSNLKTGSAIFNMSIAGIGVTEGIVKETLENTSGYKAGTHFALIYAPIPPSCNSIYETVKESSRIAAASDKKTLQAAATILESLTKKQVYTTEKTRTAEAAILFEIACEDSKTATANELARLCEKLNVDGLEAQKLMSQDSTYRTIPLGEVNRQISEDAYILLEDADNNSVRLRLLKDAREINQETAKHVANLTKDALRNCGKTLKRAKIVILGISQIPNSHGPTTHVAIEIAETLEVRGAKLTLFDPYLSEKELTEYEHKPRKSLNESLEGADCIVLLVAHEQFKNLSLNRLKHVMKMPAAIVDLTGAFEPEKIEKEGFTYRGIGRGVWSK